jgi:cytochrome b561
LALTLGRIAWRLGHRPPPLPVAMAGWKGFAAQAMHLSLYGLLLIMPLTGGMLVSGAKTPHPFSWFGLFGVPLLPVSRATGGIAHESAI